MKYARARRGPQLQEASSTKTALANDRCNEQLSAFRSNEDVHVMLRNYDRISFGNSLTVPSSATRAERRPTPRRDQDRRRAAGGRGGAQGAAHAKSKSSNACCDAALLERPLTPPLAHATVSGAIALVSARRGDGVVTVSAPVRGPGGTALLSRTAGRLRHRQPARA